MQTLVHQVQRGFAAFTCFHGHEIHTMHDWRGIVFGLLLDASTIPLSRVLLCVVRHYEYRNNVSFLSTLLIPCSPTNAIPSLAMLTAFSRC